MKFILTLIFSSLMFFASANSEIVRVKILEKILSEITVNSKLIIWCDNKDILSIFKSNHLFETANRYENANIIILENKRNLKSDLCNKYIFVLNYKDLTNIKQSFGALFWKKGRPNIVIINPRIKNQKIKISKDLYPYLEDKIW